MNTLAERNKQVEVLEGILLNAPQKEIAYRHYFANGMYAREMEAPPDTFIIGGEHTTECVNVLLSGSCRIIVDGGVEIMTAPQVFITKPGIRKVAYTEFGMRWLNVFATTETDLTKLEQQLMVKSDTQLAHEADKQRMEAACLSLS